MLALLIPMVLAGQQTSVGHVATVRRVVGQSDNLGFLFAAGDELDGDGVPDFIATRSGGRISAFSGATGLEMYTIHVASFATIVDCALIGDTDADGRSEIAASDRDVYPSRVVVYSGADGSVRYSVSESAYDFGQVIAPVGDLDRDGAADFAAHSPSYRLPAWNASGATFFYSGATGSLLANIHLPDYWVSSTAGRRVASAGDVDLDGTPDILIGTPIAANSAGGCAIISGATFGPIRTLSNPNPPLLWFGTSVADAGDCDGDGVPDQAVSTSYIDTERGMVSLFSGADGRLLWQTLGSWRYGAFGYYLVGGTDHDGDGLDDLVTSDWYLVHPDGFSGALYVLSGRDGSFLLTRYGDDWGSSFGYGLASFGDLDRDGRAEIGVSSHRWDDPLGGTDAGKVEALSWFPGLDSDREWISSAQGGTVRFALDLHSSLSGSPYTLLASASGAGPTELLGVGIPLTVDPVLLRMRSQPPPFFSNSIGALDVAGDAAPILTLPPAGVPGWLGVSLWFSALVGPPSAPIAATVNRTLTIVP